MWFIDIPPYVVTFIAFLTILVYIETDKEWELKYKNEYPLARTFHPLIGIVAIFIYCLVWTGDYFFNCIDFRNGLIRSYEARICATDIVIMTFCLSQKPWKSLKDTFSEKGITRDKIGYVMFFMSFVVIALAIEHHYYYYNGEHLLFVVLKRIGLM